MKTVHAVKRFAIMTASLLMPACNYVIVDTQYCKDYLACDALTAHTPGLYDAFGPSGACWTTTQKTADTCEAECLGGFQALKAAFPDAGC